MRGKKLCHVFWGGIVFLATFLLTYKLVATPYSDYWNHMEDARALNISNVWMNTYPMWHILVKVLYVLFNSTIGIPIEWIVAFVASAINLSVFEIINALFEKKKIKGHFIFSFILLFVTPIYVPKFNPQLYLGQGSPNTWHNPTNLMVKPFAIVLFLMIVMVLDQIERGKKISLKQWGWITLLLFLSVLAKPSFIQGMIPALGIFLIIKCVMNKFCYIRVYFQLCCCFIPAVLWMVYQFIYAFYVGEGGEGIGVCWLLVMKLSSPNVWISTLLVLAFPITYIIFNIRTSVESTDIQMAFLLVVVTWLEYAFFYEKGSRLSHGNLGWGLQLSYAIIWIVVVYHYAKDITLSENHKLQIVKNSVLGVEMMAHFACGCYYWYYLLTTPIVQC